jgi:hypothetical protein
MRSPRDDMPYEVEDMYLPQEARKVLLDYEPYRSMSPEELGYRIDIPSALGHLEWWSFPTGGQLCFTWARPVYQSRHLEDLLHGRQPHYDLWEEEGPFVWIVDMAAKKMSGVQVGRMLSYILAEMQICEIGDTVIYRRNGGARPGRFGKAIVRG